MGWLRFQKRRWRDTAAARKRRRLEAAQQRDRGPPGPQPAPRGDSPRTHRLHVYSPCTCLPSLSIFFHGVTSEGACLHVVKVTKLSPHATHAGRKSMSARDLEKTCIKPAQIRRSSASNMSSHAGADVGALFRAQAEEATHSHWQIVQVAETSSPGKLLSPGRLPRFGANLFSMYAAGQGHISCREVYHRILCTCATG